jgi:peptidoglycan/xylan/chitin deacetylase (PgdA/CDA1 family)
MVQVGIGWDADGFECVIAGGDRTRFAGGDLTGLVAFLRAARAGAGGDLVAVIDSTNGLLDPSLLAAGLDMYRVDAAALPDRPAFGSVDAGILATVDPAALTRLAVPTGTIAGRSDETAAGNAASAGVERRLAGEGRFTAHGARDRSEVALTFDDGPDPRFTGAILDLLRDHGVVATFFCTGMNAAAHPDLVARMAAEGHTVGNHTWSHPYLPELARDEVLRQVEATNDAVARVTGGAPVLARPPYGARTADVLEWLAGQGMTTVLWDVDPDDWASPGTAAIVDAVATRTRPGSVVLMHDGGGDRWQTVAALPAVLAGLLDRGYALVPVARMLTP